MGETRGLIAITLGCRNNHRLCASGYIPGKGAARAKDLIVGMSEDTKNALLRRREG